MEDTGKFRSDDAARVLLGSRQVIDIEHPRMSRLPPVVVMLRPLNVAVSESKVNGLCARIRGSGPLAET